MDIRLLLRKRDELLVKRKAIIEKAQEEGRGVLTDEERTENDRLKAEIAGLDELIAEAREIEEQRSGQEPAQEDPAREERRRAVQEREREEADRSEWRNFGEFLQAVHAAGTPGQRVDPRLVFTREERAASGSNEGVPSEGGFLVQTAHMEGIMTIMHDSALLASRCRTNTLGEGVNSMTINAVDESSRADGYRWGGIQVYWLAEAAQKTSSKPKFREMTWKPKKVAGLWYVTDELLQDASSLESIGQQGFGEEIAFAVDDAIYNGDGAGKPLGIMNSPCLVSVAKETGQAAATLVFENISKMWSRLHARSRANAVWFINQDVEPQLDLMAVPVGTGGVPAYLPAGGISASPYASLKGRPVIPIEFAATLGTSGDIMLADMSQYMLMDKGGVQSAVSIHIRFDYDETAFRFVYRVDGQPLWNSALTPYKGSNTLSPFVVLAARS